MTLSCSHLMTRDQYRKKIVTQKILLIILFASFVPAMAQNGGWDLDIMPLSEVKPGMSGYGKTVYYGTRIDTFGVNVLEILKNLYPKRDVILIRLSGGQAEHSGVVSGMSGSPIYIDNKLIGALAMRVGQFMKEPIAAVMPIEYMLEVAQKEAQRPDHENAFSFFHDYLDFYLCQTPSDFWERVLVRQFSHLASGGLDHLQPIATPLVFSGFQSSVLQPYHDLFRSLGFVVTTGSAPAGSDDEGNSDITAGSAISQIFVDGDATINSTGTVTAVEGHKLLAFGHHVFNLGPVHVPMARARVLATLPSMMASSKMAMSTDIIGVFRQDRLAGVYGELNRAPSMIPVHLDIDSKVLGDTQYNFRMTDDPALNNLTPFFLRIALFQAFIASRLSSESATTRLEVDFSFADGDTLRLQDFFSTYNRLGVLETGYDVGAICDFVTSALGVLLVNDFDAPAVEKIDIRGNVKPGENVAKLRSIRIDQSSVEPGDSLLLKVMMQKTNGERLSFLRHIPIPDQKDLGRLTLIVGSAGSILRYEIQLNPEKYRPVDYEHLRTILAERRKSNALYVQLWGRDGTMLVQGREMSQLPPSIMNMMNSRRSQGENRRLRSRVLEEYTIPLDCLAIGAKHLIIQVKDSQDSQNWPEFEDDES